MVTSFYSFKFPPSILSESQVQVHKHILIYLFFLYVKDFFVCQYQVSFKFMLVFIIFFCLYSCMCGFCLYLCLMDVFTPTNELSVNVDCCPSLSVVCIAVLSVRCWRYCCSCLYSGTELGLPCGGSITFLSEDCVL